MRDSARSRSSRFEPALFDGPGLFDEPAPGAPAQVAVRPGEQPVVTAVATFVAADSVPTVPPASTAPVLVATDGSCLRNPGGPTGWAYVRSDGFWAFAGCTVGTNQIGELQAVVLALADHPDVELEIQCDSSYAIGCATTWKRNWQRNNYINSQKKVVSNLDIIRRLHELLDARTAPVTFTKVKGHDPANRWPLNTAVDVVCGRAATAAQEGRCSVQDSGTMEIDWTQRVPRHR
ncbi:MAG: RNase H family protein [Nakamurella sp.]